MLYFRYSVGLGIAYLRTVGNERASVGRISNSLDPHAFLLCLDGITDYLLTGVRHY